MLSIVVPCYNEEAAIPLFFEEVEKISQQLSHSVEYFFFTKFWERSRLIRWFKRSNR